MARKRSDRLQALLKLAAMKEQAAVRQLAASAGRLQTAKQQRQQLSDYEHDYQQQYVQKGQAVDRNFFLNFQGFFRQLETAQVQQEAAIRLRDHEREQARLKWIDLYARRRLLNNVRERWLQREAVESDKKLQRELDDRAVQKLLRDKK
ncbi:MAG: flagellar export protein FliJ [Verrucomicrobiaceae bacterium]|nr:flagellar export protein FliJ [Verrucomicrobiaceae bacterium]